MSLSHYEVVPQHVAEQVIAVHQKEMKQESD
jgi:hypothetical protein